MTIDPTNFAKQGKPTPAQARTVWDSMMRPTVRAVAEQLQQRGYDISFSTIGRWRRAEWRDNIPQEGPKVRKPLIETHGQVSHFKDPLIRKGSSVKVNAALREEIAELPDLEQNVAKAVSAGGLAAAVSGPPDPDEMRILERRYEELMLQSVAELDVTEGKARKVFNILLLESAQRRCRVLALIPRETAALVTAMTGAAGAQLTGGREQPPAAGDARTIDGTLAQADPDNEVSGAIAMFRRKLAGEKVA
jgi:hypothetical protein